MGYDDMATTCTEKGLGLLAQTNTGEGKLAEEDIEREIIVDCAPVSTRASTDKYTVEPTALLFTTCLLVGTTFVVPEDNCLSSSLYIIELGPFQDFADSEMTSCQLVLGNVCLIIATLVQILQLTQKSLEPCDETSQLFNVH